MLMTTHTLWTPTASENLGALAGLTPLEVQLLAEVKPYATAVAQSFQETVFSRLLHNLLYVSPIEYKLGKAALEKWFVHLFQAPAEPIENDSRDETKAIPHPSRLHRKSGIPFRYVLSVLEIILKYGRRVTQHSTEPEQAYNAFQKVLGLEFARNQVYEEMYISHLSELMLDD